VSESVIIYFIGTVAVGLAVLLYMREARVRGRALLLALRIGTLIVVTLLLADFRIPGSDPSRPDRAGGKWVLIDPDLSLAVAGENGSSLWDGAVDEARTQVSQGARVAIAVSDESGARAVELDDLGPQALSASRADLSAAVTRLGEAGADSVVVVSTLRRPPQEVAEFARGAPIPTRLAPIGGTTRNVGIGEFAVPATAPADQEVSGRLSLFGEGGEGEDSVRVELRADGELVNARFVPFPRSGEEISVPFTLPPPPDTGLVRYTARAAIQGDLFPWDDIRARWTVSGGSDRGILLLSLHPDWEPRVLLPVLEAVTGLPGRGYLRLGDGRFLPLGSASEPTRPLDPEAFLGDLSDAEILVIHGSLEEPPSWLIDQVVTHPRVLHFPLTDQGAALTGPVVSPTLDGEWVPVADPPASPLSPFLAGLSLGGLPPLSSILPVVESFDGIVGLNTQGPGQTEPLPALVLLETDVGRRVVALATGFWRWGARDGDTRRAYRAVWGGAASWLLSYAALRGGDLIRPESLVQPRDELLRWQLSSEASGSEMSLTRFHDGGDGSWEEDSSVSAEPGFRGVLSIGLDGSATTPPMEPGIYHYEVRRPASSGDSALVSGLVEVEGWAPSLRQPPITDTDRSGLGLPGPNDFGSRASRPMHTHPLPYVLLLSLLGLEWVGRRRAGLR
jgi:hypothetical protein